MVRKESLTDLNVDDGITLKWLDENAVNCVQKSHAHWWYAAARMVVNHGFHKDREFFGLVSNWNLYRETALIREVTSSTCLASKWVTSCDMLYYYWDQFTCKPTLSNNFPLICSKIKVVCKWRRSNTGFYVRWWAVLTSTLVWWGMLNRRTRCGCFANISLNFKCEHRLWVKLAAESEPTFEMSDGLKCHEHKPRINLTVCYTVKETFWISRYKIN